MGADQPGHDNRITIFDVPSEPAAVRVAGMLSR